MRNAIQQSRLSMISLSLATMSKHTRETFFSATCNVMCDFTTNMNTPVNRKRACVLAGKKIHQKACDFRDFRVFDYIYFSDSPFSFTV